MIPIMVSRLLAVAYDTAYSVYGACKQIKTGFSRIYWSSPSDMSALLPDSNQSPLTGCFALVAQTIIVIYFLRNVDFFVE